MQGPPDPHIVVKTHLIPCFFVKNYVRMRPMHVRRLAVATPCNSLGCDLDVSNTHCSSGCLAGHAAHSLRGLIQKGRNRAASGGLAR